MRPKAIATFEWLYMLTILMEIVSIALNWSQLNIGPAADRWGRLAAVVISVLLVLLVSRWRIRVAAVVLAALFVIGLPLVAGAFAVSAATTLVPLAAQILLQVAAFAMLLRPESRAWLSGRMNAA